MTHSQTAFLAPAIFDGEIIYSNHAILVESDCFRGIVAENNIPVDARVEVFDKGTLAPGFVDLQVNGGGGLMLNDDPSVVTLGVMAKAHARLGATSILPTLITDTAEHVRAAIDAVEQARKQSIPGIIGLHLEGPHLSPARKGAHDESLIRSMSDADHRLLLEAAERLPLLMLTLSPENVTVEQISTLADAGVILSLGHTNVSFADCIEAVENGVSCVTHLFNAMSQLGNREPGVVGAALALGGLNAGLIADCIHVHPQSMSIALEAKQAPGKIYLVTDAMACAGSDVDHFILNDRRINRRNGRLTLEDGTLAGADLDLSTAVRNIVETTGTGLDFALAMATSIPAKVIGKKGETGHIIEGRKADFLLLDKDFTLSRVWQHGKVVELNPVRNS